LHGSLTGGHFDLIAPDPRGVGLTLPLKQNISCFPEPDIDNGRLRYTLSTTLGTNSSDTALGYNWAALKAYGLMCQENIGEVGQYLSTAFVARDIMNIVDAIGEGDLRYWGQSYGTFLGATIAAMFPDRIEAMVLDGVLNPLHYQDGW